MQFRKSSSFIYLDYYKRKAENVKDIPITRHICTYRADKKKEDKRHFDRFWYFFFTKNHGYQYYKCKLVKLSIKLVAMKFKKKSTKMPLVPLF